MRNFDYGLKFLELGENYSSSAPSHLDGSCLGKFEHLHRRSTPSSSSPAPRDPAATTQNHSEVLIQYYPLDGRLRNSEEDSEKLELGSNGDCAVLAEGYVDLTVGQFMERSARPKRSWRKLLYALDLMKFTYKVPWPLDLIANMEALKKYNQVMGFLLKVKRAKFVLDKARRWMWKSKSSTGHSYKHHLLVEQKLLHFVDAFHQYVMDRVFHSAWLELCTGMASASSLDEVIEVHEAYLLSIQRQCFVAPDKLWALIASRVKSILGLALDFYSVQQTLSCGGAATAIKARCEMEVDRIEKQFDECIAFLLRILSFKLNVGHFPHLVDLVTRINYNYFYMSSSGNLLTVPSFETAAKRRPIL